MGKNDVTLTDADIIEYNEEMLPALEPLEPTYSLVSRVRKRNIKGGDSVEIDIYVTGLGLFAMFFVAFLEMSRNSVSRFMD